MAIIADNKWMLYSMRESDNFNNFYEGIIKIIKMSIYSGFATRQQ